MTGRELIESIPMTGRPDARTWAQVNDYASHAGYTVDGPIGEGQLFTCRKCGQLFRTHQPVQAIKVLRWHRVDCGKP